MDYRIEKDSLGEVKVPAAAYWGSQAERSRGLFQISGLTEHPRFIDAFILIKKAAAQANTDLGLLDTEIGKAIVQAADDILSQSPFCYQGITNHTQHITNLRSQFPVDVFHMGAGTSFNMNVNEVLANRALQLLGRPPGDYEAVSPLGDINLHQSTNDTYPTALRVAAIWSLRKLETNVAALVEAFQRKEKEFAHVVKIGRTEMQDAVLTTLGREMGAYAEAFSRDRWRVYKCEERLRVVNLGGTAIGTGLSAPRKYIFRVTDKLREITGLGLARAENLVEATQNTDVFVEVSGFLKTCASNIFKVSNDLRLLSSGPDSGFGEIRLPARQAGSTIMPGKVNPVIPEAAAQAAMAIMAYDQLIANACSSGNLELNQYMPIIADAILVSVELLKNTCDVFRRHCVEGIEADEARCRRNVENSTASVTALVETIGYEAAQEVTVAARKEGKSVRRIVIERGLLTGEQFDEIISPENVTRLGSPPKQEE
jgi:aspartate ammonia-lyase